MKRPVVFVVMDGIGLSENKFGNAVAAAYKPTLDKLMSTHPYASIQAHGVAVGLPSDEDMGNSEVGHNAIGCGQIYAQGAKLVNNSIETGDKESPWHLVIITLAGGFGGVQEALMDLDNGHSTHKYQLPRCG